MIYVSRRGRNQKGGRSERVLNNFYNQHTVFYNPESISEAARFFQTCTDLKRDGRNLRILIDQSGYFERIGNDQSREIKDSSEIESYPKKEIISVVVSPVNFEKKLEISGSDMLAVVDGGVKVSDFVETVRKEGLFFPAGNLLFDNITMAQMVDDGYISDLESSYGRLREYILSLKIVTPAGEEISSGSHSVKDVTGYNITGFVYGANGRCGLVAKIVTKLIPVYKYTKMISYGGRVKDLESFSSRINFEVGSVNQTIYYADSLSIVYESEECGVKALAEKEQTRPKISFTKTEVEAVLTVRLESGSEDALGYAEDSIDKIIVSNEVNAEKIFESELTGRNIIEGMFQNGEEYAAAIHVSFYPKADAEYPIKGIFWKSFNPQRIHYILPCRKDTRFCDLRRTEIGRFLGESDLNFTGLKVECIAPICNLLEKLPVDDERLTEYIFQAEDMKDVKISEILNDPNFPFYGDSGMDNVKESLSPGMGDETNRINVRELNSRLLRLFDPERIIKK